MTDSIPDLVVRLRLDNSDLQKGRKEVNQTLQDMKSTGETPIKPKIDTTQAKRDANEITLLLRGISSPLIKPKVDSSESHSAISDILKGWQKAAIYTGTIAAGVYGIQKAWSVLVDSVEQYNMSIIQTAGFLTGMTVDTGDPISEKYRKSKEYAQALAQTMEDIDQKTILTSYDLNLMNREFLKQGVILDTNNKKQIEGMTAIANAVATIAAGSPNKQIQIAQETRALLQGQVNQYSQLAQMMNSQVGDLEKEVRLHKQKGDLIEWIAGEMSGFAEATKDISKTWEAINTSALTFARRTIRGALSPAFNEILSQMEDGLNYLKQHDDEIQRGVYRSWLSVRGVVEAVNNALGGQEEQTKNLWPIVEQIANGWSYIAIAILPAVGVEIGQLFDPAIRMLDYLIAKIKTLPQYFDMNRIKGMINANTEMDSIQKQIDRLKFKQEWGADVSKEITTLENKLKTLEKQRDIRFKIIGQDEVDQAFNRWKESAQRASKGTFLDFGGEEDNGRAEAIQEAKRKHLGQIRAFTSTEDYEKIINAYQKELKEIDKKYGHVPGSWMMSNDAWAAWSMGHQRYLESLTLSADASRVSGVNVPGIKKPGETEEEAKARERAEAKAQRAAEAAEAAERRRQRRILENAVNVAQEKEKFAELNNDIEKMYEAREELLTAQMNKELFSAELTEAEKVEIKKRYEKEISMVGDRKESHLAAIQEQISTEKAKYAELTGAVIDSYEYRKEALRARLRQEELDEELSQEERKRKILSTQAEIAALDREKSGHILAVKQNLLEEAAAYNQSTYRIKEMYQNRLELLKAALAQELLDVNRSEEERAAIILRYNQEIADARLAVNNEWLAGVKEGFDTYISDAADSVKSLSSLTNNWLNSLDSTLADFFVNGKAGWKDMLSAMWKDFVQFYIRTQITAPLYSAAMGYMQGMFGASGASGAAINYTGAEASLYAGYSHSGWEDVGRSSTNRIQVPASAFYSAPRLHNGLKEDEFPAILQRGERVLSRAEVSSSKGSSGDSSGLNISIYEAPGTQATVNRSGNTLEILINQVEMGITSRINRGRSVLGETLEDRYLLNRARGLSS